jgi:dTDP-4-dehydrorhamnose 3,5-epimerase
MPSSYTPQKDQQTITPQGDSIAPMIEGVTFRELVTQIDERGSGVELFDPRWGWHAAPLAYAYIFTIRPGFTKGWSMHQHNEDRLLVYSGEMEIVLYDERTESTTFGLVSRIVLTEYDRRIMNIPPGVWHALHNIGSKDVMVVNFPTDLYDHTEPDKYRLPLNNDRIPFKFDNPRGW